MNLCSRGRDLIKELPRSDWLPVYNEDSIRQLSIEVTELHKEIQEKFATYPDMTDQPSLVCGVIIHHERMLRNKRYIMAYLNYRMKKIQDLRWQTGSIIPEHLKKKLSSHEQDFFTSYDELLSDYMGKFDLDLTLHMDPPKELYIEIRVLEDCGEIITETGAIQLQQNSTHFLLRSDVEHLIRQGMAEQIKQH